MCQVFYSFTSECLYEDFKLIAVSNHRLDSSNVIVLTFKSDGQIDPPPEKNILKSTALLGLTSRTWLIKKFSEWKRILEFLDFHVTFSPLPRQSTEDQLNWQNQLAINWKILRLFSTVWIQPLFSAPILNLIPVK